MIFIFQGILTFWTMYFLFPTALVTKRSQISKISGTRPRSLLRSEFSFMKSRSSVAQPYRLVHKKDNRQHYKAKASGKDTRPPWVTQTETDRWKGRSWLSSEELPGGLAARPGPGDWMSPRKYCCCRYESFFWLCKPLFNEETQISFAIDICFSILVRRKFHIQGRWSPSPVILPNPQFLS